MDNLKVKTIDELIETLELIKMEHGNLPIYSEYDSSYNEGTTVYVSHIDNYFTTERIKVIIV